MSLHIVIMEGDETGQELLEEAMRVLSPDVLRFDYTPLRFDLSLENRRATGNRVVKEAADAMRQHKYGLKAATVTPERADDVGSPNALLRRLTDGRVIVRTGRRLPGVRPLGGIHAPISIVRMAVDGAYGAEEWRVADNGDEVAYRTERISRATCRIVAEYAFQHAKRADAKVFGGPKWTVSPTYEGMLKEEMDAAAKRHPTVPYEPQLIDATYALLLGTTGEPLVVPSLNRDGDCLSDFILQLFGSIAGAESLMLSLDEALNVSVVMAEAPHGTAPALAGKNVANPLAMIFAGAALLSYMPDAAARKASRAIYEAGLGAVRAGVRTPDLGGSASTSEFTDDVIRRIEERLDVWDALPAL